MNDSGIRLAVRLTPKAGRAGINGMARTDDSAGYVKATISAVAEGCKANHALLKQLAQELHQPASMVHVALHPSPSAVLPSSHPSTPKTWPSPQSGPHTDV